MKKSALFHGIGSANRLVGKRAMRVAPLSRKASVVGRVVVLAAIGLLVFESTALADSPLDGKWRQGPLREDYTIQQWLAGCGPSPVSGSSGGGETVSIHQDGDELSFVGAGRVYKTNACYDQMPSLIRSTHQRDSSGRSWRTNCTTPDGDPRRTVLNTLVAATSDSHIDLTETGRYEVVLAEGRCIADVKRSRSYDLVQRDGDPAVAPSASAIATASQALPTLPTAAKTSAPRVDCSSPGEPARLEVRPSRKLLRTGETFVFRGVVVDSNGCATPQAVSFALASPDDKTKLTIDANGKVAIPSDSTLGVVDLIATAAGKTTHVMVEVTSPAQYDELLARSGLNASGENENAAITLIATQQIGGEEARAQDNATRRRIIFGVLVGVLALVLGTAWLVIMRRGQRAKKLEAELEDRHADRIRIAEDRRRQQKEKIRRRGARSRRKREGCRRRCRQRCKSKRRRACRGCCGRHRKKRISRLLDVQTRISSQHPLLPT